LKNLISYFTLFSLTFIALLGIVFAGIGVAAPNRSFADVVFAIVSVSAVVLLQREASVHPWTVAIMNATRPVR